MLSPEFTFPSYLFSPKSIAKPLLFLYQLHFLPSLLPIELAPKSLKPNSQSCKRTQTNSGILKFLIKKIQLRDTSLDAIGNLPDVRAGDQTLPPFHQQVSHLILQTIQKQLTWQAKHLLSSFPMGGLCTLCPFLSLAHYSVNVIYGNLFCKVYPCLL